MKTLSQSDVFRLNPKHMSTSYLKSESNIIWGPKATRSKTVADEPPPEVRAHRLAILPALSALTISALAWTGATRLTRHRYPPGFALFARGTRLGRHTYNCAKCHRTQDYQRPFTQILQVYLAPAERPYAAPGFTVIQRQ
jgi:hypothetical protein